MSVEPSFVLIAVPVNAESDASVATRHAVARVSDTTATAAPQTRPSLTDPTLSEVTNHLLMPPSDGDARGSIRYSDGVALQLLPTRSVAAGSYHVLAIDGNEGQQQVTCQNATVSYEQPRDSDDDGYDDSTIATESSFDSSAPLPFVTVPDRVDMELSKDDWRCMYLSSQRAKRKLQHIAESTLIENRNLKRRLIQLQKLVNETRRSCVQGMTTPQPWSIPTEIHSRRRQYSGLEVEVTERVPVDEAVTCR